MPVALPPGSPYPVYFEVKEANANFNRLFPCGFVVFPDYFGVRSVPWYCFHTDLIGDQNVPNPTFLGYVVETYLPGWSAEGCTLEETVTRADLGDCPPDTSPPDASNEPANSYPGDSSTYIYSDQRFPETDAELKARAFATGVGPYYPDWLSWIGLESSFAFFQFYPTRNPLLGIHSLKWRLRHLPIPTCYLKVWLRRRKRLYHVTSGALLPGSTYTDLPPYVWEGTGNPCFPDPSKIFTHADNLIKSSEDGELESHPTDVPSLVSIQILKWSFLSDYEPPDDNPTGPDSGSPISTKNGFPTPS